MKFFALTLIGVVGWFCIGVSLCGACDCDRLPVSEAYRQSDIVFEGRIVAIEGPLTYGSWPAGRVRFKVSKVWKGDVTSDFEMPAVVESSNCTGFYSHLLKQGNDLLVYAALVTWTPKGEKGYFTHQCARTKLLRKSNEDLAILPTIAEKSRANGLAK
jgi:hypothetical protein